MRDFNRQPSVTFKMMHNIERKLNPCSAHDQVSDIPRYYLKENYTSVPIDALIQWHGKLVNECKRFADLHLMIFSLNKSHDHMSHLMDFKGFKFQRYIENFTSLQGLTEKDRRTIVRDNNGVAAKIMGRVTNEGRSADNWSGEISSRAVPRLKERDTVNEEPDARGNEASSSESKSSVGIHAQTGTLVASLLFNVLLICIVSRLWASLEEVMVATATAAAVVVVVPTLECTARDLAIE
ncbi:unnamed protein product [Lampetra planeri]